MRSLGSECGDLLPSGFRRSSLGLALGLEKLACAVSEDLLGGGTVFWTLVRGVRCLIGRQLAGVRVLEKLYWLGLAVYMGSSQPDKQFPDLPR